MTVFDPQTVEGVFRLVERPVWIVTAAAGARRGGLVATWVYKASLDEQRPVLLAALAPNHFTTELVLASRALAAHLLAPQQIDYAWRFGLSSGRDRDKFAGLGPTAASTGSPILPGVLAWLDCRVVKHYDAGDRLLFWADVLAGEHHGDEQALTEQQLLSLATAEQKQTLKANLVADIELLRPLGDAWRQRAE